MGKSRRRDCSRDGGEPEGAGGHNFRQMIRLPIGRRLEAFVPDYFSIWNANSFLHLLVYRKLKSYAIIVSYSKLPRSYGVVKSILGILDINQLRRASSRAPYMTATNKSSRDRHQPRRLSCALSTSIYSWKGCI
jgi:hypothetical protein